MFLGASFRVLKRFNEGVCKWPFEKEKEEKTPSTEVQLIMDPIAELTMVVTDPNDQEEQEEQPEPETIERGEKAVTSKSSLKI